MMGLFDQHKKEKPADRKETYIGNLDVDLRIRSMKTIVG